MNLAIVGCGFVADYYVATLRNHPNLILRGATDTNELRAALFARNYEVRHYRSLDEILNDEQVEIVLNLTNPRDHFEVSRACLQAGKHVYSEKPLATEMEPAELLVQLAKENQLQLSSAPCSLLGECAQTVWKALRDERIGRVRLVYAEMDDGLIHTFPYRDWKSATGIPWPAVDEFEVGCTMEHAGYYLTWLPAFFGPATSVTAFSSCLIDDKLTDTPLQVNAPDFSVACVTFQSGVVARLTCSIVAPHDHHLKIIGDDGILCTDDCWYYRSPVYIRRRIRFRRGVRVSPFKVRCRLVGSGPQKYKYRGSQQMDFARGVVEMAESIREKRDCRLSADFSLHVNELVLAIHNASESSQTHVMKTTFAPIQPMPWAT